MLQKRKNREKIKILLTGGHAGATVYATIQQIIKSEKNWKIFFIGGRSSLEGKKVKPLHLVSFKDTNVKYFSLFTGRLQRKLTIWTVPSFMKIPFGFIHAFSLVTKIDPDVVLSFGGYVAYPVVFVSWLMRKPIVIHEQTAVAGRANIYSSIFAKKIALARKQSIKYFKKDKCIVVGNPISFGVKSIKAKSKIGSPPTILISGGASGSVSINNLVDAILERLLDKYKVIHQTGELQEGKFLKRKEKLNDNLKKNYEVYGVVPSAVWSEVLKRSDIIISRSGANIVSEIVAVKRPAILIPLPFSYQDEQRKNALFASKYHIAKVLEQEGLTEGRLLSAIERARENWADIVRKAGDKPSPDRDASYKLVNVVKNILN